ILSPFPLTPFASLAPTCRFWFVFAMRPITVDMNRQQEVQMADMRFADVMQQERERLHQERQQIVNQQHELEGKLAEINRELGAIDAYEAAKTGKAPAATRQMRGARARPQARRGSRREALMK